MQTLTDFLIKKKVNIEAFQTQAPQEWQTLVQLYEKMGANSFDQRYKYLINAWRLKYKSLG